MPFGHWTMILNSNNFSSILGLPKNTCFTEIFVPSSYLGYLLFLPSKYLIVGWATVGWATVGWATVGWATVGWATVGWATVGWATVGWATVGWATVG